MCRCVGILAMTAVVATSGLISTQTAQADELRGPKATLGVVDKVDPLGNQAVKTGARIESAGRNGVRVDGDIQVTLATEVRNQEVVDGARVMDAGETDYVVRDTVDGAQFLSVTPDAKAPRSFTFSFPGKSLELLPDGSVVVRESLSGEPVAMIDPAWARDAQGKSVKTRFAVKGTALTQTIEPTSKTKYPVVADPRVRRAWYGASVDFHLW